MSSAASAPPRRIMRLPEVLARVGKSRTQLWRNMKAGTFPEPVQIGENSVGWIEGEIDAWLAARPRVKYGATVVRPKKKRAGT